MLYHLQSVSFPFLSISLPKRLRQATRTPPMAQTPPQRLRRGRARDGAARGASLNLSHFPFAAGASRPHVIRGAQPRLNLPTTGNPHGHRVARGRVPHPQSVLRWRPPARRCGTLAEIDSRCGDCDLQPRPLPPFPFLNAPVSYQNADVVVRKRVYVRYPLCLLILIPTSTGTLVVSS